MAGGVMRTHRPLIDHHAWGGSRSGEVHGDLRAEAAAAQEGPRRRFRLTVTGESPEQTLFDPVPVSGGTYGALRAFIEERRYRHVRNVRTQLERARGADHLERSTCKENDRHREWSGVRSLPDTRCEPRQCAFEAAIAAVLARAFRKACVVRHGLRLVVVHDDRLAGRKPSGSDDQCDGPSNGYAPGVADPALGEYRCSCLARAEFRLSLRNLAVDQATSALCQPNVVKVEELVPRIASDVGPEKPRVRNKVVVQLIATNRFPALFRIDELPQRSPIEPHGRLVQNTPEPVMMDEFGQGAVDDARDRAAVLQPRLDMGQVSIEIWPQGERRRAQRKIGRGPEPHHLLGPYAVGTPPARHPRIREIDTERDVEAGGPRPGRRQPPDPRLHREVTGRRLIPREV